VIRDNPFWVSSKYDLNADPVYPDMRLYQEIIFLQHYFKGKWVIENVISYYEPLIKPVRIQRHYFWANFPIPEIKVEADHIRGRNIRECEEALGFDLPKRGAIYAECQTKWDAIDAEQNQKLAAIIAEMARLQNKPRKRLSVNSEKMNCPKCSSPDWEVRQTGVGHCNECGYEWSLPYDLC